MTQELYNEHDARFWFHLLRRVVRMISRWSPVLLRRDYAPVNTGISEEEWDVLDKIREDNP